MGTGCDDLVVIDAKNETDGISEERRWVREHFPGFKWGNQGLHGCEGKPVDIIDIHAPDGKIRKVYFDISNFFGKI